MTVFIQFWVRIEMHYITLICAHVTQLYTGKCFITEP